MTAQDGTGTGAWHASRCACVFLLALYRLLAGAGDGECHTAGLPHYALWGSRYSASAIDRGCHARIHGPMADTADRRSSDPDQNAHLLSLNVKVTGTEGNSGNLFWVEALEDCAGIISLGDTILVTADSDEIASILEAYQDSNSFRIYFPIIDETSNEISVTCYDVIQYNSEGGIIQQKDGENEHG